MKDYFGDDESNLTKAKEQAKALLGETSDTMTDRDLGVFFKMKQKMNSDGATVAEAAKSNETKSSTSVGDKNVADADKGIKWEIDKTNNKSRLHYKFGNENKVVEVEGTDSNAARKAVFKAMNQAPQSRDDLYGFYRNNFKSKA